MKHEPSFDEILNEYLAKDAAGEDAGAAGGGGAGAAAGGAAGAAAGGAYDDSAYRDGDYGKCAYGDGDYGCDALASSTSRAASTSSATSTDELFIPDSTRLAFKPSPTAATGAYKLRSSHQNFAHALGTRQARPARPARPEERPAPLPHAEPEWSVANLSAAAQIALEQLQFRGQMISLRSLKKVFRKLALKLHPDAQAHAPAQAPSASRKSGAPDSSSASSRRENSLDKTPEDFLLIQEAYEIAQAELRRCLQADAAAAAAGPAASTATAAQASPSASTAASPSPSARSQSGRPQNKKAA